MKTSYNDLKTPEMVEALRQLWADLAEVEQIEPGFGSYPPDLDFGPSITEGMSSSLTDDRHWHMAPDQHYFLAGGVDPHAPAPLVAEVEEVGPDGRLRAIVTWCLLVFFLAEVWALLFWVGAV